MNHKSNPFNTNSPFSGQRKSVFLHGIVFSLFLILLNGCSTGRFVIPTSWKAKTYILETTGYCKCQQCCGWKRNWLFQPVYASGPNKGKRKKVGITASGTKARPGTIAADTRIFPFGTIMYIPYYGYGRVEDTGGNIKGYHIDLFFKKHEQALRWGRRKLKVRVWIPPTH